MDIGISTACYYPMLSETALDKLLKLGFKKFEFFANCDYELSDSFIDQMFARVQREQASFVSLHLYTAAFEGYLFFSDYERRFRDAFILYEKYFIAAKKLGASYVIMHGGKAKCMKLKDYAHNLRQLIQLGENCGVKLLLENVYNHASQSPDFIYGLREFLGEGNVFFNLDFKQAYRSGVPLAEMIHAMGSDICNIHVNDYNQFSDCLLPGTGILDFYEIKRLLQKTGYKNSMIIEVYSKNFQYQSELTDAFLYLDRIFNVPD